MSENVQKFRVLRLQRYPMLVDGTNDFEIEREPQYEEEWVNGVENEKMFLTRFDKIFWNENVCALSACLSAKQMQLYLITEDAVLHLSLTKATEQKCL